MTERETLAYIEQYLAGELSEPEKFQFEQQLQNSTVFADRYNDYLELKNPMNIYKTRTALKQKLNAIHSEVIDSAVTPTSDYNRTK